jgi:hypothetical protein
MRARPTSAGQEQLGVSWTLQLRWPGAKVVGRYLTPFLERHVPAALMPGG